MAAMIFWKYLTQIYLSLFAGHFVDNWSPKRVLLFSNLGMFGISVYLWIQFRISGPHTWALYASMALMGAFDSVKNLSFQTLTSRLIEAPSLARYNGMITVFENIPPVLGPPLAAVALNYLGIKALVGVDALSFLIALLPLFFIPTFNTLRDRQSDGLSEKFLYGLKHIFKNRELLHIQIFFMVQNFLNGIAGGLVAAFILTRTQGDQNTLALVTSAIGLAAVLGGLWQTLFPVKERLVLTIIGLTAIGAVSGRIAVGIGFGALAWAVGFGIRSFANPIVSACNQTYWQQRTDVAVQGRVFGARRLLGQGLYPLAVGVGALLSNFFVDPIGGPKGSGLISLFILVGTFEFIFASGWWIFLKVSRSKLRH